MPWGSMGTIWAEMGLNYSGLSKGMQDASRQVQSFDREMTSAFRSISDNISESLSEAGRSLSIGITVPLAAAGGFAAKLSADFETAMANVWTITDISKQELEGFGREIEALSTRVPQSAKQLADGLYDAISSGIRDVGDAIGVVEIAAKAAQAGMSDTATAVDALTSVLNSYGMAADQAGNITDIMFRTVDRGKITFGELAGSIGQVVSTAATANVAFEEIAAAYATLTRGGINAAEASTAINQAILTIIQPSKEAADYAEQLGIEFSATALESKGLVGVLDEVYQATGGNIEAISTLFPNVRALKGVLGLVRNEMQDYTGDLEQMATATGATETAFAKQMETGAAQAALFKNEIGALARSLGNELWPILNSIMDALKPVIEAFKELPPSVRQSTVAWGLFAVSLGPVMSVLGALGGLLTGPAGIVLGISAVVAGIYGWVNASRDLEGRIQREILSAQQAINESVRQARAYENQANELDRLIQEYDSLQSKTSRTEIEQRRLAEVIQTIAGLVPEATIEFDAFGNSLDVNIAFVRAFREELIELKQLELELSKIRLEEVLPTLEERIPLLRGEYQRLHERMGLLPEYVAEATELINEYNDVQIQMSEGMNRYAELLRDNKMDEALKYDEEALTKLQSRLEAIIDRLVEMGYKRPKGLPTRLDSLFIDQLRKEQQSIREETLATGAELQELLKAQQELNVVTKQLEQLTLGTVPETTEPVMSKRIEDNLETIVNSLQKVVQSYGDKVGKVIQDALDIGELTIDTKLADDLGYIENRIANFYEYLRDIGKIPLEDHIEAMQSRLETAALDFGVASDEWMQTWRQLRQAERELEGGTAFTSFNEELQAVLQTFDDLKSQNDELVDSYQKQISWLEQNILGVDGLIQTQQERARIEEQVYSLSIAHWREQAELQKWTAQEQLDSLDKYVGAYVHSFGQMKQMEATRRQLEARASTELAADKDKLFRQALEQYDIETRALNLSWSERLGIYQRIMDEMVPVSERSAEAQKAIELQLLEFRRHALREQQDLVQRSADAKLRTEIAQLQESGKYQEAELAESYRQLQQALANESLTQEERTAAWAEFNQRNADIAKRYNDLALQANQRLNEEILQLQAKSLEDELELLNLQRQQAIEQAEKTGADVLLVNQKYDLLEKDLIDTHLHETTKAERQRQIALSEIREKHRNTEMLKLRDQYEELLWQHRHNADMVEQIKAEQIEAEQALRKQWADEDSQIVREAQQALEDILLDGQEKELLQLERRTSERLAAAKGNAKAEELIQKAHEAEHLEIVTRYTKQRNDELLDLQIQLYEARGEQDEAELARLDAWIEEIRNLYAVDSEHRLVAEKIYQVSKMNIQRAANERNEEILRNALSARRDLERSALDLQLKDVEDWKQRELAIISASTLDEAKKEEARTAIIEAAGEKQLRLISEYAQKRILAENSLKARILELQGDVYHAAVRQEHNRHYAALMSLEEGTKEYELEMERHQLELKKLLEDHMKNELSIYQEIADYRTSLLGDAWAMELAEVDRWEREMLDKAKSVGASEARLTEIKETAQQSRFEISQRYLLESAQQEAEFQAEMLRLAGDYEKAELQESRARYLKRQIAAKGDKEELKRAEEIYQAEVKSIEERYAQERLAEEKERLAQAIRQQEQYVRDRVQAVQRQAALEDWSYAQIAQATQEILDEEEMSAELRSDLAYQIAYNRKKAADEAAEAEKRAAEEAAKEAERLAKEQERLANEAARAQDERVRGLSETIQREATLYEWGYDQIADAIQSVLDAEIMSAKLRTDLEYQVALNRKRAADDAVREAEKQAEEARRLAEQEARIRDELVKGRVQSIQRIVQLEDWSYAQIAQAIQEVLDEEEMSAELRSDLTYQMALNRKKAADEAAEAEKKAIEETIAALDKEYQFRRQLGTMSWKEELEHLESMALLDASTKEARMNRAARYYATVSEIARTMQEDEIEALQTVLLESFNTFTAIEDQGNEMVIAIGAVLKLIEEQVAETTSRIADEAARAIQQIADSLAELAGMFGAGSEIESGIRELGRSIGEGFRFAASLRSGDIGGAITSGIALLAHLNKAIDNLSPSTRAAQEEFKRMADEIRQTLSGLDRFGQRANVQLTGLAREYQSQLEQWQSAAERRADAGFFTRLWWGLTGTAPDVGSKAGREAAEAFVESWKAIAGALDSGITSSLQRSIRAFIDGTELMTDVLRDGIRNAIIDAITQAMVQGALIQGSLGIMLGQLTDQLAQRQWEAAQETIQAIAAEIPAVANEMERLLQSLADTLNIALPGDPGRGGRRGTQISEITGPTRDLLIEIMRPLTVLDSLPVYAMAIEVAVYEMRDAFLTYVDVKAAAEAGVAANEYHINTINIHSRGQEDFDQLMGSLNRRAEIALLGSGA